MADSVLFSTKAWFCGCHWLCQCFGLVQLLAIIFCCDFTIGLARAADPPKPPAAPTPNVALRVLVVNEAGLAEAIERLRGEWAERSGATLSATTKSFSELAEAKAIDVDLVIFPTRYLGEFCTRGWLRPVRKNVLESKDADADDYFPLVRQQLISWGGQVMALPLGIDLPVMCYRADLFGKSPSRTVAQDYQRPPDSWNEYVEFARGNKSDDNDERPHAWVPSIWEPVESWASVLLLIRAASYAARDGESGNLFDAHTMKPQIERPPFARALIELCDASNCMYIDRGAAKNDVERELRDPREASCSTAKGEVHHLSIGLPPAGHRNVVEQSYTVNPTAGEQLAWTQVPGASDVYDPSTEDWRKLQRANRIPVIGFNDRLVAVTTSSRNAASAFKLLDWLASVEASSQLARTGNGTMPVRISMASSPLWYDPKLSSSERNDLGKVLHQSLSGGQFFIVPRIPGIDEYLAALDEAVKNAVFDKVAPQAALNQASSHWERITDARGRDAQRQAYLKHLGIAEP